MECKNKVVVMWRHDGTPVEVNCGQWWAGEMQICESCEAKLIKRYPQGWAYYPGDICEHGVYVGGSGADLMCFRCEMGE